MTQIIARFRLFVLWRIGQVLNLAGLPGFVRDGDYRSSFGTVVSVRRWPLYTVVTVNGIDVYFYRISGGIDGVGFVPDTSAQAPAMFGMRGE